MRLPIGYALGWPERLATPFGALDWSAPRTLDLRAARPRRSSPASTWPTGPAAQGGAAPAWLNAANEVAVAAFLDGRLAWLGIAEVVARRWRRWTDDHVDQVEAVLAADAEAGRGPGPMPWRRAPDRGGGPVALRRAHDRSPRSTRTGGSPRPSSPTTAATPATPAAGARWCVQLAGRLALVAAALRPAGLGRRSSSSSSSSWSIVMLHELGHFATAKWAGMKVTEYFVGFGPRLWSVRRGETEYGVKAIPAGGLREDPGFTNLEEIDPEDEPRTYRQQPFHKRIIVASAGSVMHFLIAFVLA